MRNKNKLIEKLLRSDGYIFPETVSDVIKYENVLPRLGEIKNPEQNVQGVVQNINPNK